MVLSNHSLAECYAVLTALPVQPRISPQDARQLVEGLITLSALQVEVSGQDYRDVIHRLADSGIQGGAIYDALIARAAHKADVEHLVTFNERHFQKVWPAGADKILSP